MMPRTSSSIRGSVVLVALCFVAVLAIAVTTYLTLSSRAMNLSARSYNSSLSAQLAELGMELSLSAMNNANWTNWTTSGATATRTHTPAANYGQGIAASVKILITNRNASTWRSATTYAAGNAAWYRGQWYLYTGATGASIAPPPDNTSSWASAPGAWSAYTPYAAGDIAIYNDVVYRCLVAHTGKTPPESTYWTASTTAAWNASTSYAVNNTVLSGGTVYKCITAHSNQTPPNTSYWAGPPVIYTEGIVTLTANAPTQRTQLRAEFQPAALFPNAVGATNSSTSINLASSGTIESYNSNLLQPVTWSDSKSYIASDTVYHSASGQYYRSLVAHYNRAPTISGTMNASFWTPNRSSYSAWVSSQDYSVGDMVTYMASGTGKVYRCILAHTSNPGRTPTDSTYWLGQAPYTNWSASKTYAVGDLVCDSSGAVFRCISAHTSNSSTLTTTNSSRWGPASTWVASKVYAVGDLVAAPSGAYYRCISTHTSNATNQTTANASLWEATFNWASGNSYAVGNLVMAPNGATYRCIVAHTSDASTNSTENSSLWDAVTPWNPFTSSLSDLIGYPLWGSGIAYSVGTVVYYQPPDINGRPSSGMLYRCRSAHTSSSGTNPTSTTYWEVGTADISTWTSTTGFRVGDIAFYPVTGLFYRCKVAHTNQAPASATATNTSYWEHTSTNYAAWSSTAAYSVGDIVYRASNQTVYRCIQAHTNQAPPNATYWSTSMSGYSAVVAAPAVTSASTATIRGYVNATTTSFGTSAVVQGPTSAASPKVDPARVFSNPYVPQFDPPGSYSALSGPGTNLPSSEGNGTTLYEGARTLGTPGATTPSVYNITATYYGGGWSTTSGLYLDASADVLTIVGPVILNISGILYTNSGRIVVAPTGSLEIYFNGSQLYIGNSTSGTGGGIINQTFNPAKMLIVSASTYNSSSYHYYWSRFPFHGVIYMPSAYLHKWNSGYNGEIYGAVSAKTVYFNHPATLDYDMALRSAGSIGTYIEQPFQVTAWRELTDPADKVSL